MRRLGTSLLSLSLIAFALPARGQVATFSNYSSPTTTEYQATVGRPVTSGALDFYDFYLQGSRNALGTWGTSDAGSVNRPSNIGGSTAMFATQLGELVDLYGRGSDLVAGTFNPFNIFSMDVGHLYSSLIAPAALSSFTFTVFGSGPGTGFATITQAFTILAPAAVGGVQTPLLQTVNFDARWRNLENVYFYQTNSSLTAYQFTNVAATLVPEPGTYLLTLVGLAAVGVIRVRRRQAR